MFLSISFFCQVDNALLPKTVWNYPVKVVEDPCAETSRENRIVTSIKIKDRNRVIDLEEDDESPSGSEED